MKSVLGLRGGLKFWIREPDARGRDPLLEQTLSFVQGIAASKSPETTQLPELERPIRVNSEFMNSERTDFQQRVRQFRAHQQKIRQGREEHYNSVWQKTRASLGNAIEGSAL